MALMEQYGFAIPKDAAAAHDAKRFARTDRRWIGARFS